MNCTLIVLNYMDKERALSLAQKCKNFDCINHIIIVDNCSPDESYNWLTNHLNCDDTIIVLKSKKNGGFSYGNNYGAKFAIHKYNPEYILFANTDTFFDEQSLQMCLYALKDNQNLGLISLRMKNIDGYEEISCWKEKNYLQSTLYCLWLYRRKKYDFFHYEFNDSSINMKYVDVVRGSFMCFKSQALIDINYFDENTFLYYEEDIISKRLKNHHYKIAILTNYYYIHDHKYEKNFNEVKMKHNLDNSMYYLLKTYYHINILQKIFTKLVIYYSIIEFPILDFFKKRRKK